MTALTHLINGNLFAAILVLILSFAILAKCADLFVDSAVSIASKFKIPKVVIGIVLVSLATTAPELTVSMMAAIANQPQMALGNALGSVACNLGLALALCALFSPKKINVCPNIRRLTVGFMFLSMLVCTVAVVWHGSETVSSTTGAPVKLHSLTRTAGVILLLIYAVYATLLIRSHRSSKEEQDTEQEVNEAANDVPKNLWQTLLIFVLAIAGIIASSRFIVLSATSIAERAGIPEAIIALTLVALGTSIPEVATCVAAARRGHGEIAVGNVIGANILNICWVAGGSSIVNDLTITRQEMYFMFPSVAAIVIIASLLVRKNNNLTKSDGVILLLLYGVYIALFAAFFKT